MQCQAPAGQGVELELTISVDGQVNNPAEDKLARLNSGNAATPVSNVLPTCWF